MVYIRGTFTDQTVMVEVRPVYMRGSFEARYDMYKAMKIILSHIMPAKLQLHGETYHGGFHHSLCFESYPDSLFLLGNVIDMLVRTKSVGVLENDGMVPTMPSRLRRLFINIIPLRKIGLTIRLLMAHNWLAYPHGLNPTWPRRIAEAKDDVIYIEGDSDQVKWMYEKLKKGKIADYVPTVSRSESEFKRRHDAERECETKRRLCMSSISESLAKESYIIESEHTWDYIHLWGLPEQSILRKVAIQLCKCMIYETRYGVQKAYTAVIYTPYSDSFAPIRYRCK